MGLLDSVIGALGQGSSTGLGGQAGNHPLLQVAIEMLSRRGDGAGALTGGLGGLMDSLQRAGLDEQLKSWIGTGHNIPISPDQLNDALGADKVGEIAARLGLPQGQVSGGLAELLPQLIDRITPHGQLPGDHSLIDTVLGGLLKR